MNEEDEKKIREMLEKTLRFMYEKHMSDMIELALYQARGIRSDTNDMKLVFNVIQEMMTTLALSDVKRGETSRD